MADTIEIGSVLGGTYEVVRMLGRGGMGAVWEAKHLRLPGKRVAVKVLHGERATDENVYARFRREAEIASRLGNPNIIEALDFNTLPDGTPYIVLEFLEGETLGARIRRGPIPTDEALGITRQIGSALAAAHRAGIVHRDLKPENIFLTPTDAGGEVGVRVKILDFGISKIKDSLSVVTSDQTVLGTPQYMSPEQASAKHSDVDGRTDQFALGAIVYEMLSGVAAFGGPTMVSVIYKVMTEQPEPLPKVRPQCPPRVAAAVERALSKDPRQRFADIAAFVEALTGRPLMTLDRARAGELQGGPPSSPESLAETTARPGKRGAMIFAAGAFVVAVAAVTAVVLHKPESATTLPPKGTDGPWVVASRDDVRQPPAAAAAPPSAPIAAAAPPAPAATAITAKGATNVAPNSPVVVALDSKPQDAHKPDPARAHAAAGAGTVGASAIPPEVAEDIAAAESALASGNAAEAIRVARRSLATRQTARAFSIVARAFCKQGDLGNARAQLPHVGGERGKVLRECKAAGVDLK